MALLHMHFKSPTLVMQTNVTVVLPESEQLFTSRTNTKLKTLYLLHGLSNDSSIYTRFTNIERYASNRNVAVVMPSVDHSFYADMKYGHNYFSFVQKELRTFMLNVLPLSDKREDNFVAGHSMGGYGAFKLALTNPELFSAAASLSGAMDINRFLQDGVFNGFNAKPIFGEVDSLKDTEHDLYKLLKDRQSEQAVLPKLLQMCGTEDYLYEDNVNFKNYALSLKTDLDYREGPGDHNWEYWEYAIKEVMDWLPLD